MRWGKIIPVILFLVLILTGVSYAWQGIISLSVPVPDISHNINANLGSNSHVIELSAIRIYLEPLVPASCKIQDIANSYQQALKSA